jgi:drug/metabolite transporter (DMT)-like permease
MVIAAYRLSFASVVIGIFTFQKSLVEIRLLSKNQWITIIFAGILLAIHFAVWITSLEYTSVASSVVLVTTTPIWVALLSPVILHEKVSRSVTVGLIIAMLGVFVLTLSSICKFTGMKLVCDLNKLMGNGGNLLGNFLALMGAWAAAGYVMVGRKIRQNTSVGTYTLLVYSISAVILLGLASVSKNSLIGYTLESWVWMILLALIPQVVGHTALNWALGSLPAAFVSIALLGEPIGSSLLAWLFLFEEPTFLEIFGALLILIGITFAAKSWKGEKLN